MEPIPFTFYLPIIGQLIAFLLITLPSWSGISGNDEGAYDDPGRVLCINRGIVAFGLFLQMGCMSGAVYIVAGVYGQKDDVNFMPTDANDGIMIFLGNLCVFLGTWLMRWGSVPPMED